MIKNWTMLETSIAAVSRIREFSGIPQEEVIEDKTVPPCEWPEDGELEFRNVSATYKYVPAPILCRLDRTSDRRRQGEKETLKHISFKISSGKKLAIVGRSGRFVQRPPFHLKN